MYDPHVVKKDFPIFKTQLSSGRPLVYLDSAATSQKPQVVIDAISKYYTHDNANVHRGIHELGDRATRAWHESRKTIASFFGALSEELIVTRNTTEALNMVAYSLGEELVGKGDLILATQMDHHSNLVPWQELARRKNAKLELIPVTRDGLLDLEWLGSKLKLDGKRFKLLALPHVSNTLGTINPIPKIAKMVRELSPGALIILDAAQSAPHMPVNFHDLGVDCLAVSAHKMLGPMGIGGLFVRKNLLSEMRPLLYGGGMIGEVYDDHATFAQDPEDRYTAGTPDVASAVGWAAACEYLTKLDVKQVYAHDQETVRYALEQLAAIPQVSIVGPMDTARSGSVAFLYEGVHPHDVAQVLSSEGVAVRSGHHCTMPLHKHMDWVATTRLSFNVYTTKEDVDTLIRALAKVKTVFGK